MASISSSGRGRGGGGLTLISRVQLFPRGGEGCPVACSYRTCDFPEWWGSPDPLFPPPLGKGMNLTLLFVAVFLGYNQYWPSGFMVLRPGAPKGSCSDFKAPQMSDHSLKSYSLIQQTGRSRESNLRPLVYKA